MSITTEDLCREYETFQNHKQELVASSLGKFAVISGENVLGGWDTYQDALKAGYESCGVDEPFMVQRITLTEQVHSIYRGVSDSC